MVTLLDLWLPILAAAVLIHLGGFVMWMVLPHHRGDWKQVPDEDGVLAALRKSGAGVGQYYFPYRASREAAKDPAWLAKAEAGPMGFLIIGPPGLPRLGKSLLQYFLYTLGVSFMVGYIASHTLPAGAPYLPVFRVVGAVATLAYAAALVPGAIWFSRSWGSIAREMFDGLVFGLLTAGVFGWLWPR
ncbi:MAG TPA: hypothetical protein PKA66_01625 [Gemmatimonadales bacterium]|nr:hypothetical protein [Gemmatimonadales bacterium]